MGDLKSQNSCSYTQCYLANASETHKRLQIKVSGFTGKTLLSAKVGCALSPPGKTGKPEPVTPLSLGLWRSG